MANYIVTQATDPGQATICTNAQVGIGTSIPAQALTLVGIMRTYHSSGALKRSDYDLGQDNSAHINAYDDGSSTYLPVNVDGSSVILNAASGGLVGIGTTSPAYALDVIGTIRASGSAAYTSEGTEIAFNSSGNPHYGYIQSYNRTLPGFLPMYIDGSSLYLNSNSHGNVGIGTASPQANLQVIYPYSKTDTTERFAFEVSSNDSSQRHGLKISSIGGATQDVRKFLLQTHEAGTYNTGILGLQPFGGAVGIGCTDPQCKLDVNDNCIRIRSSKTPTHSYGASGDKAGMIAWDSSYLYVCRGNYDGSTNIWRRITLPTGTW
jgi:hypothetical protein